jgi:hypothetical protein
MLKSKDKLPLCIPTLLSLSSIVAARLDPLLRNSELNFGPKTAYYDRFFVVFLRPVKQMLG